jgi:hypothetical protein
LRTNGPGVLAVPSETGNGVQISNAKEKLHGDCDPQFAEGGSEGRGAEESRRRWLVTVVQRRLERREDH